MEGGASSPPAVLYIRMQPVLNEPRKTQKSAEFENRGYGFSKKASADFRAFCG